MLQIVASLTIVIDDARQGYEAKEVSSITIVSTFIVLASFTIVTYDRQKFFLIQATGMRDKLNNCFRISFNQSEKYKLEKYLASH